MFDCSLLYRLKSGSVKVRCRTRRLERGHGPGGYRIGAPALTKQNELYIEQQLQAFAQGTRANDMNMPMRTISAMLTESEMRALSHVYANENIAGATKEVSPPER